MASTDWSPVPALCLPSYTPFLDSLSGWLGASRESCEQVLYTSDPTPCPRGYDFQKPLAAVSGAGQEQTDSTPGRVETEIPGGKLRSLTVGVERPVLLCVRTESPGLLEPSQQEEGSLPSPLHLPVILDGLGPGLTTSSLLPDMSAQGQVHFIDCS